LFARIFALHSATDDDDIIATTTVAVAVETVRSAAA
jgi:hypothetical protein